MSGLFLKPPYPVFLVFVLVALCASAVIGAHAAADNPDSLVLPRSYLPFVSNHAQATPEAPVITSTPRLTATVNALYTYDVDATGIPTPTFSLVVSPSGMTIDSISGLIQWTPAMSGTYSVTVRAGNGITPTAEQPFVILTEGHPGNPVIISTPPLTATVCLPYTYDVDAAGSEAPSYSLVVSPPGMTIDGVTGLIRWSPMRWPDPESVKECEKSSCRVSVRAGNGIAPDAEQSFVIQREEAPRWDPCLDLRFASLVEASVTPGEGYWRLIKARWLDEKEALAFGPDHHILMDALDENGQRKAGVRIIITNGGASPVLTQEKPGLQWAADFPMSAVVAPAYSAQPADGAPADRVVGMGLGSLEAPNFTHHASYYLVWQWTIASP